ncbi:MAG: haloalkane dehalogenase, partial [Mycobacteriales bacterium]
LRRWDNPFLTLFADSDPITGGAEKVLAELIPGAAGQPHAILERAGHFLQEDVGEELAEHLLRWLPQPG